MIRFQWSFGGEGPIATSPNTHIERPLNNPSGRENYGSTASKPFKIMSEEEKE